MGTMTSTYVEPRQRKLLISTIHLLRADGIDMRYETILAIVENDVVRLELNRPDVHNAFNDLMIAEITDFFGRLTGEEGIAAVVITGNGKSFCAGADLNWMKKMAGYSKDENIEDARKMADMFVAIENCPFPTIARVNGAALGGGVGFVAVCDFAFAVPNAKFSLSEAKLGLIPAVISKWVIERIGTKKAKQFFMTGERFESPLACEIGLIDGSVHDLDGTIGEVVGQFRTSGPNAIAESKKLVNQYRKKGYLDRSITAIADLRASDEGKEGIAAFLEKRKPAWRIDHD